MPYRTSIGLDVHARSVSACALDHLTGEIAQRSFSEPAPQDIVEWARVRRTDAGGLRERPHGLLACQGSERLGARMPRGRDVQDAEAVRRPREEQSARRSAARPHALHRQYPRGEDSRSRAGGREGPRTHEGNGSRCPHGCKAAPLSFPPAKGAFLREGQEDMDEDLHGTG